MAQSTAHPPSTPPERCLIIAHRGASGYRPEHTAEAYALACALGADAVEPDIVLSKDGVLVVRHENEISETTDVAQRPEFRDRRTTKIVDGVSLTGWFTEDFSWAELATLRSAERLPAVRPANVSGNGRGGILRLRDVCSIIDRASHTQSRKITIVIEIKHAHYFAQRGYDIAALLDAELREISWRDRRDQLVIESFELGVLEQVRELGVPAPLMFLLESEGSPADERGTRTERSYAWYRSEAGLETLRNRVDGVSVAKRDLMANINEAAVGADASTLVESAHARGLRVYVWTLRPESQFLVGNHAAYAAPKLPAGQTIPASSWGDWRAEFRSIVCSGVDGIFVDHPDLGRQIVREHQ